MNKKNNTDKKEVGRTGPSKDADAKALETIKVVASALGVSYGPNIGLKALETKVADFIENQDLQNAEKAAIQNKKLAAQEAKDTTSLTPEQLAHYKKQKLIKDATRQKRIAVTCMNPNKKDWEGEVITVSNSSIATQKKYVPFNGKPWHVPTIIFNVLKERQCQMFKTVQRGKHKIREGYLIPEFSITELPPLTENELQDLRKEQAMSNRLG